MLTNINYFAFKQEWNVTIFTFSHREFFLMYTKKNRIFHVFLILKIYWNDISLFTFCVICYSLNFNKICCAGIFCYIFNFLIILLEIFTND